MVRLILYCILSLFLCSASAKERGALTSNGKREILIKDPLKPSTRSSDFIRLIQEDSKLEAFFYDDLGSISINIYNNFGSCIYQTDIDTNMKKHIYINLSSYNKGNYRIIFTTDRNTFYGNFQL